ncbi:hypothetical protein JVT61DRAFT_10040 [Boletus reticuloceps]|uniref:Uncharacterized protein n=1 Tax=Boletus reticuloceps TaxID=495285 RepID=A0A8I2YW51_9AGAM|nr:hypothetical protein JVT61DRAFT_10040 [Boletus reticuloceps]
MTIRAPPRWPFCKNSKDRQRLATLRPRRNFLTHFVGDMHTLLHPTRRKRGGKGDKVARACFPTSFYSALTPTCTARIPISIPYRVRFSSRNVSAYSPDLRDGIYNSCIRRLVWEGLLDTWVMCPAADSSTRLSLRTRIPARVHVAVRLASVHFGLPEQAWANVKTRAKTVLALMTMRSVHIPGRDPSTNSTTSFIFPKELDGLAPRYCFVSTSASNLEDDECRHSDGDEDAGDEMHSWGGEETATFGTICS